MHWSTIQWRIRQEDEFLMNETVLLVLNSIIHNPLENDSSMTPSLNHGSLRWALTNRQVDADCSHIGILLDNRVGHTLIINIFRPSKSRSSTLPLIVYWSITGSLRSSMHLTELSFFLTSLRKNRTVIEHSRNFQIAPLWFFDSNKKVEDPLE